MASTDTSRRNDRLFQIVMPAHAGIHDLLSCRKLKSWMPPCAGMTAAQRWWITLVDSWYEIATGASTNRGLG
jgi:hypothetical protein